MQFSEHFQLWPFLQLKLSFWFAEFSKREFFDFGSEKSDIIASN